MTLPKCYFSLSYRCSRSVPCSLPAFCSTSSSFSSPPNILYLLRKLCRRCCQCSLWAAGRAAVANIGLAFNCITLEFRRRNGQSLFSLLVMNFAKDEVRLSTDHVDWFVPTRLVFSSSERCRSPLHRTVEASTRIATAVFGRKVAACTEFSARSFRRLAVLPPSQPWSSLNSDCVTRGIQKISSQSRTLKATCSVN